MSISDSIKGNSYTLKDSEYNANDTSYYLYRLDGGNKKSARVSLKKVSGAQRVVGLVVSENADMSLKPGSSEETSSNDSTDTSNVDSDGASCFAPSDYTSALGYSNPYASTTSPYLTNIHFLADSLEYSDSVQTSQLDSFAKIATTNPGKDYSVKLSGSVATESSADLSFADKRANKIKQELVTRGMATDKITIDPPKTIASAGGNSSSNETAKTTARVVVMEFYPACVATDSK